MINFQYILRFIGKPTPDLFVMGLGLWDIVKSPLSHEETLSKFNTHITMLKSVIKFEFTFILHLLISDTFFIVIIAIPWSKKHNNYFL